MCGIAGQVRWGERPPDAGLVARMTRLQAHRGPDGEGFHRDRHVALGHRRLALVDPLGPGQPFSLSRGRFVLSGNFEIYNHPELRRELAARGHRFRTSSDSEVVLRLFAADGPRSLERLVGMYALAIWDADSETLHLARDPFGIKPLHYAASGDDGLVFASELEPILLDAAVDRSIDGAALRRYLQTMAVPEPTTAYAAVRKVPPGHTLSVRRGRMEMRGHRRIVVGSADASRGNGMDESLASTLRCRLEETACASLVGDVEVGCFLSGGLDSSALVASVRRAGRRLRTYSLGFDEPSFDERRHAEAVSRAFGTEHRPVSLSAQGAADLAEELPSLLGEPFADSSALPTLALARTAAEEVKAVLSGEGADELFGGSPWHRAAGTASEPVPGGGSPPRLWTRAELDEIAGPELAPATRGTIAPGPAGRPGGAPAGREIVRAATEQDRSLAADLRSYLPSDLLTKMDRLPMRAGLEVRVPYLNLPFASWVAGLPFHLKVSGGSHKVLLRRAMEGVLPPEVLARPKQGFAVPMDVWLWRPGRFRDQVYDVLLDQRTRERGWIAPIPLRRMLEQHDRLARLHGHRLWTLFVLESWCRRPPGPATGPPQRLAVRASTAAAADR